MFALAMKSCGVLGLALLLTTLLRKRSAAERHLVWTASAAAVLVLPLLSIVMPVLRVPAFVPDFAMPVFHASAIAPQVSGGATPAVFAPNRVQPHRTMPNWPALVWSAGTLALLIRMLAGYALVWRMRLRAGPFENVPCQVNVLETTDAAMPMSFGILRPVILLPAEAREWTEDRLRVVLAHEVAHVRRGDAAWHMLAWIAASVYWWNPLAWLAWKGVRRESEGAADDLVLEGVPASDYAGHLLEIARNMNAPWAAVAMARRSLFGRSHLEGRVRTILDANINRTVPGRAAMITTAILAAAVILPLAALRAQDAPSVPADVDAAIRTAIAQKNHKLLENAAKAAAQLREYDTAHRLLESAVAIRAQASGTGSYDYGIGLLKLGELEERRHHRQSADELYTRAAAILGNRPEAARALTALGVSAILNQDLTQAADDFAKARSADSRFGPAIMWMGVVRDRQGEFNEAKSLFERALAAPDPSPADELMISRTYARFLQEHGLTEQAAAIEPRITAAQNTVREELMPNPAAGSTAYKIGGSVVAPRVLSKVEPDYSDDARATKLDGTVRLGVEIGPDGVARNFNVAHPLGLGLDESAMDAISQWHFQPGMKDGEPVTVAATIEVSFHLR